MLYFVGIFGVCQESQLAGAGVLHARDAVNFKIRVAVQDGSQPLGYVS